jgi:hypothetical protein
MSGVESAREQLLSRGCGRSTRHIRRFVFSTARDDTLAVLFSGDRLAFREWARSLEPELSQ